MTVVIVNFPAIEGSSFLAGAVLDEGVVLEEGGARVKATSPSLS
jgi:hypothetical protein